MGIFHRDSSVYLCSTDTPNFNATKSFSKAGRYALRCAPNFMKSTPGPKDIFYLTFMCRRCLTAILIKNKIL